MQQHAARSIKQMCLPDVVAPGVVSVRPDDDIVAVDCYRNPKIVTGGHGGVVEGAQKVTRCHIKQICLTDVFAYDADLKANSRPAWFAKGYQPRKKKAKN